MDREGVELPSMAWAWDEVRGLVGAVFARKTLDKRSGGRGITTKLNREGGQNKK